MHRGSAWVAASANPDRAACGQPRGGPTACGQSERPVSTGTAVVHSRDWSSTDDVPLALSLTRI